MRISLVLSITSLLLLVSACSKQSEKSYSAAEINAGLSVLAEQQAPVSNQKFTVRPEPQVVLVESSFKNQFCDYIVSKGPEAADLTEHFADPRVAAYGKSIVGYLFGKIGTCKLSETLFNAHPVELVRYDLGVGGLNLTLSYDINNKVSMISLTLEEEQVVAVSSHMIEMKDGVKLHGLLFKPAGEVEKRGTVFIKTPYLHTSPMAYTQYGFQVFTQKGYNVFVQSNRGVYLSGGDFKWLDSDNVSDSKTTIEWLAAQDFSNGKVMAFGVSYDGYSALASAVSKAEALKTTVACSAPAHAFTDSFTSGGTVEIHLLSYIWGRENRTEANTQEMYAKILELEKNKTPKLEWDNIIFGRDVADWPHIVEASKNPKAAYWQERSLLAGLKDVDIEVMHVAGLNFDQDSRDTVLAYQVIQNESRFAKKHRLHLHKDGHGCGVFMNSAQMDDYLSLISDSPRSVEYIPRVMQFSTSGYQTSEAYPVKETFKDLAIELEDAREGVHYGLGNDQVVGLLKDEIGGSGAFASNSFSYTLDQDIIVNGMASFELKLKSNAPGTIVKAIISYYTPDEDSKEPNRWYAFESSISRSQVVLKGNNEVETVRFDYVPRLVAIPAGSEVVVYLTTIHPSVFELNQDDRTDYFDNNISSYVSVLKGSKAFIPVEDLDRPADVVEAELAAN
jgi:hypothetical protein